MFVIGLSFIANLRVTDSCSKSISATYLTVSALHYYYQNAIENRIPFASN